LKHIDPKEREKVSYIQRAVQEFFKQEGRKFPWRETRNPYIILVSELLLQKTNSKQVLQVFDESFNKYPTVKDLIGANLEELKGIVGKLGLVKKARFLKEIANEVMNTYGGKIPDDNKLLKFKGVGMYTANAVLCFAYGKRVPIVDSNVARVLRRYFKVEGNKPAYADRNIWRIAKSILPLSGYREFNYGLIDISAKYCRPKPLCNNCPLKKRCCHYVERDF